MPRNYIKKTNRAAIDENNVQLAISAVRDQKVSIGKAAQKYGLKKATLQHRLEKNPPFNTSESSITKKFASKYTSRQVFSVEEENALVDYILKCSKILHGLSLQATRRLAFEYARSVPNCKYPSTWDQSGIAGRDWLYSFRERHPNISLRTPENTSASRAYAFNKHTVSEFFNNYEDVLKRYKFEASQIYNYDETGVSTVMKTPKVLADKKQRQVGQIVSAERGQLVTLGMTICAVGTFVPPVYVFPRVQYKDHFLHGALEGSLGLAAKTGWMNTDLFPEVLKHIHKNTRCSKDHPILLIMDNHESHISLKAIDYAREKGIVFLTLHPHTSHRMQPLDVGVLGPFKSKCKIAFNDWHLSHPGKTLTIYEIPILTKNAFIESFTVKNIGSGFKKSGIWPVNTMAFSDEDFLTSYVTDRDITVSNNIEATDTDVRSSHQIETIDAIVSEENVPSCPVPSCSYTVVRSPEINEPISHDESSERQEPVNVTIVSPESIRPLPKADKRKHSNKGREPGKSRIWTDTPEKRRLEEIVEAKRQKEAELMLKRSRFALDQSTKPTNKKIKKRRTETRYSSETSEESVKISTTEDELSDLNEEDSIESYNTRDFHTSKQNIEEGDFVVVKFTKKKSIVHYVAKVMGSYSLREFKVNYLRKKPTFNKFFFPKIEDEHSVDIDDIVQVLTVINTTGTKRCLSLFSFAENLSGYNFE